MENPVLTAADVTDLNAMFVADPFLYVDRTGVWHMFFEVLDEDRNYGVISHATSFDTGRTWDYDRMVIDPGEHTSFPFVFGQSGEVYMALNRAHEPGVVRLYRATAFPTGWERLPDLFDTREFGNRVGDVALFRWDDRWYALSYGYEDGTTNVYHARTLRGGWSEHAMNPVVAGNERNSRPAGRPVVVDDCLYVFYQRVDRFYGESVLGYRVDELSPTTFRQREVPASPVLDGEIADPAEATAKWNSQRMHHYDPQRLPGGGWRCAVDGSSEENPGWSIGIYRQRPD